MEAVFVRDLDDWRTSAKLWRIDGNGYVATSATHVMGTPETYVFIVDKHGEVLNWSELPGSFKGGLDHDRAINDYCESGGEW